MVRPPLLLAASALIWAAAWWHPGSSPAAPGTSQNAAPPPEVAPHPDASGIVEGTVRLETRRGSDPPMLGPYSRRRYRPPSRAGASSSPRDVVVFLLADGTSASPASDTARIVQRDRTILPHVTAIRAGTPVSFPNEDDVYHNLFSLSEVHPFNLGRYPPGETRVEVFDEPGVVRMFCDIHSEMTGVIRVLDTPHFTRPDDEGSFRLPNVPPGLHRLVVWHESAGSDTVAVQVPDGGVARVELSLGE